MNFGQEVGQLFSHAANGIVAGVAGDPPSSPDDPPPLSAPSTPVLAALSDDGALGDGITSSLQPTIQGTAEAGTTIDLSSDGDNVGEPTADSSGHWSLTTPTLSVGSHSITAVASRDGQTSDASAPLNLTVDVPSLANVPSAVSGLAGNDIQIGAADMHA